MISTLSLQSSEIDTSTLLAIFPREIAYSQNTVGLTIYNGEEESITVRTWVNGKPYTISLDVIINDVGEFCAFDNRRLYAARNYAPTEWHFMVRQHAFTDLIPPEKLETGAAYISLWWEMIDPASGEPEVHCFKGVVSYWGLMVAFRCACQSPSFSLNGSYAEPTLRQSPFPYPSYYKVDRIGCKQIPLLDDPITALTSAIDRDQTVCFSRSDSSILMHRPDFIQLLLRHIEGVQVDSYGKYTRRQMVFRAKGEENDGHWPDDGELFRAEQQRIEDIDTLWMESDLAQVRHIKVT